MSLDKEQIRARITCADILSSEGIEYNGRDINCPLPTHNDSNPSFGLCHDDHSFKCHGCGASGDVFKLLMELTGCDFPHALADLADRAGVEDDDKRKPTKTNTKDKTLHATANAAAKAAEWPTSTTAIPS